MLFGYARVSTKDQNLHMQFDALKKYGVEEKNIYSEKITGTKKDRPAFTEMLKYLREGDTVVVYKLDRIGRSTKHLVDLINDFQEKGINFVSINENIDTTTAMGKLVFTIFSGLAQFERDIISERTKSDWMQQELEDEREEDQKKTNPSWIWPFGCMIVRSIVSRRYWMQRELAEQHFIGI